MNIDEQKKTWNNFTSLVFWGTIGIVTILVLMAIFLL